MEFKHFIGIDVSKDTLDFSLVVGGEKQFHLQTTNNKKGIMEVVKKLKQAKISVCETVFCMEHTGLYNEHLLNTLSSVKANIWLESSLHIKQSSGLQRGKNDKVDSLRIALFAYKNREDVKLWLAPRQAITELKHLTAMRSRVMSAIKQLQVPLKENKTFMPKALAAKLSSHSISSLKGLKTDLEKINNNILTIIKEDERLNHLFCIVTSVDGIGPITATQMLINTNEFKNFHSAKQFACYAGVAPFEHSSGTSVRGRTRVSNMANKTIKTLLFMASLSASKMKGEMNDYFIRKTEQGKNKMSVLNAIRNKLILRIFACVKLDRKYSKNLNLALV